MFYIVLTVFVLSVVVFLMTYSSGSKRIFFNRRNGNIALFKEEQKNLRSNKNLSKDEVTLLLRERELNLLQDVPKTTELEVELGREYLISPIFLSIIAFISMSLIYFYPVSLGSIEELKTHKLIYSFIDSENELKENLREELIIDVSGLVSSVFSLFKLSINLIIDVKSFDKLSTFFSSKEILANFDICLTLSLSIDI